MEASVFCKTDLTKYMLSKPVLRSRIGRWMFALLEFSLPYVPAKAVKRQETADFLDGHPCVEIELSTADFVSLPRWTLYFDGSRTVDSAGVGIVSL